MTSPRERCRRTGSVFMYFRLLSVSAILNFIKTFLNLLHYGQFFSFLGNVLIMWMPDVSPREQSSPSEYGSYCGHQQA